MWTRAQRLGSRLQARLRQDVQAVLTSDPAARSALEVLLAYPGVHAVWLHRVAHLLWQRDLLLTARLVSHFNRLATGIEIHPGARLAPGVFIDHGMGVVIGETAEVGERCLIYKGVVLGGVSLSRGRRHPRLGAEVIVGSNACVLGAITVGDGARIGSGSVVIRDVPAGATVVGVPGRIVTARQPLPELGRAEMPDPVAEAISLLADRLARLEERLRHWGGTIPSSDSDREIADGDPFADPFSGAVEGRRDWPASPKPSKL